MSRTVSIGARIKEARQSVGLDRWAFARVTGYSHGTIRSWEINARHPRVENLRRLSEVTGREVSWFFEEPK